MTEELQRLSEEKIKRSAKDLFVLFFSDGPSLAKDLRLAMWHSSASMTDQVMFESLFSERGLSLDRLKVLIEVRDAGSIAQAAPGDLVRQSQYSRQLRELSEFFGCEVAQRRGKLLKLTEQGERLAELARDHLRSLEDFRSECREESVAFTIGAGRQPDSVAGHSAARGNGPRVSAHAICHGELAHERHRATDHRWPRRFRNHPEKRRCARTEIRVAGRRQLRRAGAGCTRARKKEPHVTRIAGRRLPLATQTTDGQFTSRLREIAKTLRINLAPALSCQSFPQTMAAVSSGRFAAIVPALALRELGNVGVQRISDPLLRTLDREAMLAWNPRLVRVRPNALKISTALHTALRIH